MSPDEISAGARTVVDVAEHFGRLKERAHQLAEVAASSNRGFFTPTEDEQTRHLQVSYWQSRNALIEVVLSFHQDETLPDEMRPAGFLVAYAGALVLVDAARFLREEFHERPVVRGKLNEPAPQFGIPEGTYDRVQKSLTSPVHAWHLYHAARYFEQHQTELKSAAADDDLAPLMDIVQRLQERIDVSIGQYAVARTRVRARELATTVTRDLLFRAIYGLQKAVSQLISDISTQSDHKPALPAGIADELRGMLKPGDVLITRKEHALTNYFLPGYWPHAALYLGDEQQLTALGIETHKNVAPRWRRLLGLDKQEPHRVLEAMKDGVRLRSLATPFACDAMTVLRPRLNEADVAEALCRGMFHDGKAYDFDFDFTRADRLVGTEVVYRSYENVAGVKFELTPRAGRLTLAAEDLIRMAFARQHFEPLAVFAPSHSPKLLLGEEAEQTIRATMEQS
ncbi:MAG: hypothetical protein HON53_03830 [Planctomycetaceae bacterium]|nr:hypothetical protein [Planctomycetaceae bacterium]